MFNTRNYKLVLFLFILLLFFIFPAKSQKCKDYKYKECRGYGPPYKYSQQSKSAYFEKGTKSDFYIVTYGGYEYNITICHERNLKGTYFRIRENNPTKTLLYDSSTGEEEVLDTQFYVEETKKLIIEVIVPEGDKSLDEESYKKRHGCVGVLIEYHRRPTKGF
ncbi:MAG: hypothetical protein KAT68_17105 [Bacteroidales bacterium]|nr:hypothetical protein [Bacteroidales bacterium]